MQNNLQNENEIEINDYFYLNIFHYPPIINPIKQHEKRVRCLGWIVLNKDSGSVRGSWNPEHNTNCVLFGFKTGSITASIAKFWYNYPHNDLISFISVHICSASVQPDAGCGNEGKDLCYNHRQKTDQSHSVPVLDTLWFMCKLKPLRLTVKPLLGSGWHYYLETHKARSNVYPLTSTVPLLICC